MVARSFQPGSRRPFDNGRSAKSRYGADRAKARPTWTSILDAQVLISDRRLIGRLLEARSRRSRAQDRCIPKRVLVTTDGHTADPLTAPAEGIDACLSVRCGESELLSAVNRVGQGAPAAEGNKLSAGRPTPGFDGTGHSCSASCKFRGGLAPGALRRVKEYIEQQLVGPVELRELAKIAKLSQCHFARAFKQSTGLPLHQYLIERRIDTAATLMRESDRPLSHMALDVGFADQSHFTRTFSRLMNETPRAFRHRHR